MEAEGLIIRTRVEEATSLSYLDVHSYRGQWVSCDGIRVLIKKKDPFYNNLASVEGYKFVLYDPEAKKTFTRAVYAY